MTLSYFRRESRNLTWFLQSTGCDRLDGRGEYGAAGVYKNWNRSFYTYTSVGGGSHSGFLPQLRIDQDLNYLFGPRKNFVWTLGGTYIRYHDVHRDFLVSTGLMAYVNKWIFQYRFFQNTSSPGSQKSYSQTVSAGFGQQGKHWTFGTFSYGNQTYLRTNLITPELIDKDSLLLGVNHRRWIGKYWGLFGDFSYFQLQDGYDKYRGLSRSLSSFKFRYYLDRGCTCFLTSMVVALGGKRPLDYVTNKVQYVLWK